jgi:ABC-type sugar transport system, periplasmic component
MKKILAIACMLLLVTSFVFANGAKESASQDGGAITKTAPDEKVTLRFAWWGSNTRHQATLEAIKLYEERHPNVTIEGEYGAFGDYYQKLLTQLAGGTAPDIISVDYKWVSDLRSQGNHFVNMYDLESIIDTSGFDMNFARIYGGDDKYLIGIPVAVNGMGYLYNEDFMKRYGIEPSNDWTWETVIENGKKVNAADSTKYLLYNNAEHWMYLFKTMMKQLTAAPLILDDKTLGFSREDAVKVFSYVKELVDTKTVPPFNDGVLYENVYADQNPNWIKENFGVFPTSSSLIPGIMNASSFPVASMRFPVMADAKDPGILVTPSVFFSVYGKSAHQDVAADFINFMLNDPDAIEILKDTRGIPCNSKAQEQLVAAGVIPQPVSDMVSQALSGAGVADNGPSLNPEVIALIKDFVQQVGYGVLTPEAAADGFIKELTSLVKTF